MRVLTAFLMMTVLCGTAAASDAAESAAELYRVTLAQVEALEATLQAHEPITSTEGGAEIADELGRSIVAPLDEAMQLFLDEHAAAEGDPYADCFRASWEFGQFARTMQRYFRDVAAEHLADIADTEPLAFEQHLALCRAALGIED